MAENGDMEQLRIMMEGAEALHDLYLSYVAAGFSEEQAMRLLLGLMTANMGHRNENRE